MRLTSRPTFCLPNPTVRLDYRLQVPQRLSFLLGGMGGSGDVTTAAAADCSSPLRAAPGSHIEALSLHHFLGRFFIVYAFVLSVETVIFFAVAVRSM